MIWKQTVSNHGNVIFNTAFPNTLQKKVIISFLSENRLAICPAIKDMIISIGLKSHLPACHRLILPTSDAL